MGAALYHYARSYSQHAKLGLNRLGNLAVWKKNRIWVWNFVNTTRETVRWRGFKLPSGVCLSVTVMSLSSVETDGRIELVFMWAFLLHMLHFVMEIQVSSK